MNARDTEMGQATGGGPGGAAAKGERNIAPANESPHAKSTAGPASGVSRAHESARAQVAGAAPYVDDIPEIKGTLHAAPITSNVAHGRLKGVDATTALAMPGVLRVGADRERQDDGQPSPQHRFRWAPHSSTLTSRNMPDSMWKKRWQW